jgi:hypothetical protein
VDSFSDKLKTVLSDPAAMETIASLAKGFAASSQRGDQRAEDAGRSEEPARAVAALPAVAPSPAAELMRSPAIKEALRLLNDGSRERVALLKAMRPFVKEEKKEKLDRIIQTMQLLDLLSSAEKLI